MHMVEQKYVAYVIYMCVGLLMVVFMGCLCFINIFVYICLYLVYAYAMHIINNLVNNELMDNVIVLLNKERMEKYRRFIGPLQQVDSIACKPYMRATTYLMPANGTTPPAGRQQQHSEVCRVSEVIKQHVNVCVVVSYIS